MQSNVNQFNQKTLIKKNGGSNATFQLVQKKEKKKKVAVALVTWWEKRGGGLQRCHISIGGYQCKATNPQVCQVSPKVLIHSLCLLLSCKTDPYDCKPQKNGQ